MRRKLIRNERQKGCIVARGSTKSNNEKLPHGWREKAPGVYIASGEKTVAVRTSKHVTRTVEYWTNKFEEARREASSKTEEAKAKTI